MHTTQADEITAAVTLPNEPKIMDTYALVYAYTLILLLPGLMLASTTTYKSYSPSFLLGVMGPFAVGMFAVFMTDSLDPLKQRLIRAGILLPLVSMTGVAVMFGSSIALVPLSPWIRVDNFAVLTVVAIVILLIVLLPLPIAVLRRLRGPRSVRASVQSVLLVLAILLTVGVSAVMVNNAGMLGDYLRKDLLIYLVGAVGWYLPSVGLAAGIWRRLGIV